MKRRIAPAARVLAFLVLAVSYASTVIAAPPPVITGASPSPLVAITKPTVVGMSLYGRNFWPSGPNDPSRRVLSVRRQNLPFQTIRIDSMGDTVLNFEILTSPLLLGAGQLEFMVTIDGMPSNVFAVKIVADPPGLAWVMPDKIALVGTGEDRWKVWLAGSKWIPATSIFINGTYVRDCFQNLNSGKEQLTWPDAFRKAGKYGVQVRTEHGGSEIRTVEVTAPITYTKAASVRNDAALRALATPTPTPAFAARKGVSGAAAAVLLKPTPTPTPTPAPEVRRVRP